MNISANLNLNNAFNKPHHLGQFLLLPIITAFFVLNNFVAMLLVNIFNVDFNTFYFKNYQFTSNMVKTSDLSNGFYRLLATDNNVPSLANSLMKYLLIALFGSNLFSKLKLISCLNLTTILKFI